MDQNQADGTNEIGIPMEGKPIVTAPLRDAPEMEIKDEVKPNEICPHCNERASDPNGPRPMIQFVEKGRYDSTGKLADESKMMWVGCVRCLDEQTRGDPLKRMTLQIAWYHITGCEFPNRNRPTGPIAVQIDTQG